MSEMMNLTESVKKFMDREQITPILEFPNVTMGWEMDCYGWVCRHNKSKTKLYVVTTHGKPYIADSAEISRIRQDYLEWIKSLNEAINLRV